MASHFLRCFYTKVFVLLIVIGTGGAAEESGQILNGAVFTSPAKVVDLPFLRYAQRDYRNITQTLKQLAVDFPNVVTLTTAQREWGNEVNLGADFYRNCGGEECELLIARIGARNHLTAASPQMYISGALHGDERLGPNIAMELALLLATLYGKNPIITYLLNTREIWVTPTTNAWGYAHNLREENGVDVNRDFPYMRTDGRCMETLTARALNELFLQNLFQLVLTFHGGMRILSWEWGGYNHAQQNSRFSFTSAEAPDMNAQISIAAALQQASGLDPQRPGEFFYPSGSMIETVYPVNGGFEDWSYAASWEPSPDVINVCHPHNYNGYPVNRSIYPPEPVRSLVYLLETDDLKNPPDNSYGTSWEIFEPSDSEGHIPRNVRLCLKAAELLEADVLLSGPPYIQSGDSNDDDDEDLGDSEQGTSRATLALELLPVGCREINSLKVAIVSGECENVTEQTARSSPDQVTIIEDDAKPCRAIGLWEQWDWDDKRRTWDRRSIEEEGRIAAGVPLTDAQLDSPHCAVVLADFDKAWSSQANPEPAVVPQTHLVQARVNESYHVEYNGKRIAHNKLFPRPGRWGTEYFWGIPIAEVARQHPAFVQQVPIALGQASIVLRREATVRTAASDIYSNVSAKGSTANGSTTESTVLQLKQGAGLLSQPLPLLSPRSKRRLSRVLVEALEDLNVTVSEDPAVVTWDPFTGRRFAVIDSKTEEAAVLRSYAEANKRREVTSLRVSLTRANVTDDAAIGTRVAGMATYVVRQWTHGDMLLVTERFVEYGVGGLEEGVAGSKEPATEDSLNLGQLLVEAKALSKLVSSSSAADAKRSDSSIIAAFTVAVTKAGEQQLYAAVPRELGTLVERSADGFKVVLRKTRKVDEFLGHVFSIERIQPSSATLRPMSSKKPTQAHMAVMKRVPIPAEATSADSKLPPVSSPQSQYQSRSAEVSTAQDMVCLFSREGADYSSIVAKRKSRSVASFLSQRTGNLARRRSSYEGGPKAVVDGTVTFRVTNGSYSVNGVFCNSSNDADSFEGDASTQWSFLVEPALPQNNSGVGEAPCRCIAIFTPATSSTRSSNSERNSVAVESVTTDTCTCQPGDELTLARVSSEGIHYTISSCVLGQLKATPSFDYAALLCSDVKNRSSSLSLTASDSTTRPRVLMGSALLLLFLCAVVVPCVRQYRSNRAKYSKVQSSTGY